MNIPMVRFVDRNLGVPLCRLLVPLARRGGVQLPSPEQVTRIAVLKFVGMGNLVLASPTLSALRRRFPGARVTFVTLGANRRLLETNRDVDDIFYFDAGGLLPVIRSSWRLLWHLRSGGYQLVVDLEPYSRYTALMSLMGGIRWRVGFDMPGQARGSLFNLPVLYTNELHIVQACHTLAERLGADPNEDLELTPVTPSLEDEAAVESFLLEHHLDGSRPIVGMHVGTGDNAPVRRWPPARFGKLADALIREFGVRVVFTGSPKEAPLVEQAIQAMQLPAVNAAGKLSIPQLAGMVSRCAFFVSGDTGPLHIAAAQKVPVVGLYGPNVPELYGPWGKGHVILYHRLPCSPCISNLNDKLTHCAHGQCIQSITVDEVLSAIRERLGDTLGPAPKSEAEAEVLVG